jgi:hypothetical protein
MPSVEVIVQLATPFLYVIANKHLKVGGGGGSRIIKGYWKQASY